MGVWVCGYVWEGRVGYLTIPASIAKFGTHTPPSWYIFSNRQRSVLPTTPTGSILRAKCGHEVINGTPTSMPPG